MVTMEHCLRDQVMLLTNWFSSWNDCEQVAVLYTLLRKMNATQAKFLSQVLEEICQSSAEVDVQEQRANDPAYIGGLCKESKDVAVAQLLLCLPLLKVGNNAAKAEYLRIMPMIMKHSIEKGVHCNESRQLLSYSLIHPAILREELPELIAYMSSLSSLEDGYSSENSGIAREHDRQFNFGSADVLGFLPSLQVTDTGYNVSTSNNGRAGYTVGLTEIENSWKRVLDGQDSGIGSTMQSGYSCRNSSGPRPLRAAASFPLSDGIGSLYTSQTTPSSELIFSVDSRSNTVSQHVSVGDVSSSTDGGTIGHQKLTRTSSVQPVSSLFCTDWVSRHHDAPAAAAVQRNPAAAVGRSFLTVAQDSLHTPLSPQSSLTSSGSGGSEAHPDELQSNAVFADVAMRDVSVWLKSLRLHKYSSLFQQMTYDEMLTLTDEWLEIQGVTKGARNKILISVKKLHERQELLRSIEKVVTSSGNMRQAIQDVRQILLTPIKNFTSSNDNSSNFVNCHNVNGLLSDITDTNMSACVGSNPSSPPTSDGDAIADGDIPGQVTRVLGKMCTQLLVTIRPESECLNGYLQILEKCINHAAFSGDQKRKMMSWRQQIQRVWQFSLKQNNVDRNQSSFSQMTSAAGREKKRLQMRMSNPVQPSCRFNFLPSNNTGRQLTGGNGSQRTSMSNILFPYPNNCVSPNTTVGSRPANPDVAALKQPLSRTQSAPLRTPAVNLSNQRAVQATVDQGSMNEDIHASLDSLCISMMEHAMGGNSGD